MEYSKDGIERIVRRIVDAVNHDRFTIEENENRQKNIGFRERYGIKSEQSKQMLQELIVEDFCSTTRNFKPGFEEETLYIFGPQFQLYPAGEKDARDVVVYVKINIIERSIDDIVIVVSFHEAERAMTYAFK